MEYIDHPNNVNTIVKLELRSFPKGSGLTFLRPCVQEEVPHNCACTPSLGSDSHGSKAARTRQGGHGCQFSY